MCGRGVGVCEGCEGVWEGCGCVRGVGRVGGWCCTISVILCVPKLCGQ